MKLKLIYTFLLFGITIYGSAQKKLAEIIFLHPSPGSKYINIESTIILKLDESLQLKLNESSIQFIVNGERSGYHTGKTIISGNTIIFDPDKNFEATEIVNVSIKSALFKDGNEYSFSFETSSLKEYDLKVFQSVSDIEKQKAAYQQDSEVEVYGKTENINGVSVPADFPKMDITVSNETAEGKIFIANWGGTSYMMILENDGTPYFYKRFPNSNQTRDFKVQPTGTLTRLAYDLGSYVEMDSQYVNIDTLRCKNGYGTDEHECQILPDNHFFLIGLDYQNVDMSQLVSGGNPNATVIGNTVQELDENHNVVFQWRSWDNFDITDAVHENLTNNTIDYVHMNSIAIDYDSNIVISSRHLSEVTKINRKTGEIIWRFGGENNQFTLANDTYGISYQHDARPVPGKPDQYTIFDNGNFRNFSRVVEFKMDTAAMTATKIWEYRHSPDYSTHWMGNAQRLENGNTFVDWADNPLPKAFEVTPSGEVVYQANFQQSMPCYRAFRFDWESVVKVPYLIAESYSDKVTLIFNKFGDKKVEKYIIYGGLSQNPTAPLDSTSGTSIDLTNLANNGRYYFRVTARDSSGIESPFSNQESVVVNFVPAGENFIVNGDFSNGTDNWIFNLQNNGQAQGSVVNGEFYVSIDNGGSNYYDVQLIQESFPIINGKTYLFE
ncbi:MAG: aryl-sulfate sulfotransferase, partial [Ignavibacteria bacterium]